MKIHLFFCSIIFIFLLGFGGAATAANTYTWTGGTANWNVATNWLLNGSTQSSSGSYPGQSGTTDIVNFNTSSFTVTVPSSLTLTVASLTTNYNTSGSAGVFGIIVSVSSGSVLTITSGVSITQPSSPAVCLTLAGSGTTKIAGTITAGYQASMTIASGANVYFNAATLDYSNNQGVITNNGTLSILSGSVFKFGYASYMVNTGTVNSKGVTFNLQAGSTNSFNNSGTVRDHGSTFSIMGQGVNMLNSGSSASFYGSGTTITDASNGSNTFVLTNSSSAVFTLDSAAVVTLNQQTDAIKNTATFSTALVNPGCTINLGGQSATFSNTSIVNLGPGTVVNPSGTTVTVSNSSGGTFTLMSGAAGSAAIGVLSSTASVSGVYNVQRYITGTSSNFSSYRLLSMPVNCTKATSATSSSSLNYISLYYLNKNATANGTIYNGIFTGGPGGTAGGFNITTTNPILYFYNETLKTSNTSFTSGKNVGISAINNGSGTPMPTTVNMVSTAKPVNGTSYTTPSNLPIPVGNGFIDYFVGPNTISSPAGPISSATITNIGYINQQNVTVYLWYTPSNGNTTGTAGQLSYTTPSAPATPVDAYRGLNMLGNPYPSTLNLAQVFTDNTGIDNIYVLNDNTSSSTGYNVYTATGNSSPSPAYVVSGQGFLAHATSGGQTFTFQEGEKAPTQQLTGSSLLLGIPKQTDQPLTGLYMKMVQDSATYQYCGIYFRSDWASTFKTGDAITLNGASPKVYMSSYTSDGVQVAVNHQPDYTAGINVKLYANATADGIYHLNIEGIRNIDTLYDIFLIDHYKKDSLDMRRYGSYAFNVYKSDTSSFGGSRFELSIHPRPLPAYVLVNFAAQKASSAVQLTWKTENEANYTGFALQKLDGTQYNQLNSQQSNGSGSYSFTDHNPVSGSNTYRLQQSGITGSITYSSPVTVEYGRSGADGAISVYPNPVKDVINLIINQNSTSAGSTSGTITINSSAPSTGSVSYGIKIMNISGAVVMSATCTDSEWHQSAVSLVPGTYIIQVVNNKDNSVVGKSLFVKI